MNLTILVFPQSHLVITIEKIFVYPGVLQRNVTLSTSVRSKLGEFVKIILCFWFQDDHVVVHNQRPLLAKYDKYLKAFRYTQTLDAALSVSLCCHFKHVKIRTKNSTGLAKRSRQ